MEGKMEQFGKSDSSGSKENSSVRRKAPKKKESLTLNKDGPKPDIKNTVKKVWKLYTLTAKV